tara:strand:+ start:2070 stop:2351 length:282 start_codon:yes stop_codon:yes gene_type:complete
MDIKTRRKTLKEQSRKGQEGNANQMAFSHLKKVNAEDGEPKKVKVKHEELFGGKDNNGKRRSNTRAKSRDAKTENQTASDIARKISARITGNR